VPSFSDLHIEFLLTVLNRLVFGGRLAPGEGTTGQCYIISGEAWHKCCITLHGVLKNWHFFTHPLFTIIW